MKILGDYTTDEAQKKIDEVMNFKGSEREKQLFLVCNQLQISIKQEEPTRKRRFYVILKKKIRHTFVLSVAVFPFLRKKKDEMMKTDKTELFETTTVTQAVIALVVPTVIS